MARKTDGEKVDELVLAVAAHTERLDQAHAVLAELSSRVRELELALKVLRRDVDQLERSAEGQKDLAAGLAVVKHELGEVKKGREETARRLWAIIPPLVAALVGGVLGYLLKR